MLAFTPNEVAGTLVESELMGLTQNNEVETEELTGVMTGILTGVETEVDSGVLTEMLMGVT